MTGDIILASSSPYRKMQLDGFGLPTKTHPPLVDEESLKDQTLSPVKLCEHLARSKAKSVQSIYPQNIVIGADQLIDFHGEIIGKAGSQDAASQQLLRLSGQTHRLITSLCVLHPKGIHQHTDETTLTMRPLHLDQAKAYVSHDKTWDCAGSYKLERSGLALFEKIQSEDFSAIIGLPLMALTQILLDLDVSLPFFYKSLDGID